MAGNLFAGFVFAKHGTEPASRPSRRSRSACRCASPQRGYPAISAARARAAAAARAIRSSRPPSDWSTASAAAVVPPGEVTFRRRIAGGVPLSRRISSPAPSTVPRARTHRKLGRQAELFRGGRQRLRQREHVGWPAPEIAVTASIAGSSPSQKNADRAKQTLGPAPLLRVHLRAGEGRGDAPSDRGGGVRHRADDRPGPRKARLKVGDGLAGQNRENERPRVGEGRDPRSNLVEALRFHRKHKHVRRRRFRGVERDAARRRERGDLSDGLGSMIVSADASRPASSHPSAIAPPIFPAPTRTRRAGQCVIVIALSLSATPEQFASSSLFCVRSVASARLSHGWPWERPGAGSLKGFVAEKCG